MERSFMSRTWASLTNTLFLFVLSLGFFALFSMQIKNLVDDWPKITETMKPKVEKLKSFVFEHTPLSNKDLEESSKEGISVPFIGSGSNAGKKAATFFNQTLNFFGNYLLTFVYVFFSLNYRRHFKKFLLRLFPDEKRNSIENVISQSANVTQQYLLGKLILIVFLSIFYAVGLGISGVNNFILVSILAAIFSLVPYLGNILGFGMAMIFGYLTSGDSTVLIGIILTFTVGQFVESYVLQPYIVGDKVDLHPFITVLVVVAGSFVWGLVGMILAIPLLAILNIVFLNVKPLNPFGYLLSKEGKTE
jgi:predicted PurR-regulated permease PerM